MGCGSCGSGGCASNGCGRNGGCATGGCNKLNTFDWLGNMLSPDQTEADNVYEVRFKNTRKAFYRNIHGLRLNIGDVVVVESDRGYDVGTLSLGGIMAQLQMRKKTAQPSNKEKELPRIYRKASEKDLELLEMVRGRETETRLKAREIIGELKLDMKLTDVEFQGDNTKAIFYYIADHRVDFRELIKKLAQAFRIRVEMKQIGLRHEAALVGGIGSCGRELCCSTWLTDFKTVSTSAARYQNLSLNPMKISGLCGRLKCCLNYELETYLDAIGDFPQVNALETQKGTATLQKTDIFKRKMWFSYYGETTWYPVMVDEVKKVVAMNKRGEKPESLGVVKAAPAASSGSKVPANLDFVDVVGTHLPPKEQRSKQKRGKRKPNKRNKPSGNQNGPQSTQGSARPGGNDQQPPKPRGRSSRRNPKGGRKGPPRNKPDKKE